MMSDAGGGYSGSRSTRPASEWSLTTTWCSSGTGTISRPLRRPSRPRSRSRPARCPPPVAAVIAKLYPKGRIHEVKRETRPGGRIVYAVEIFIGDQQYDVEATEEGTVLRNEAE